MSIKTAKVGKVTIEGNTLGENPNATLNITLATAETTPIGVSWRELVALTKSWNLSLTVNYDPSGTALSALRTEFISGDGDLSSVQMYEDGTHYFAGSASIITAFNLTKSAGSQDQVAITIEGNSELTYT